MMRKPERLRWHRRAHRAMRHSLRLRLVALFLLLAFAMTVIFLGGMQKALSFGWRDAARPLLADYVDRLAAEIGSPPDVAHAQALVQRLPITVRIHGPVVNWESHPDAQDHFHRFGPTERWDRWDGRAEALQEPRLLRRVTADGHRIDFGVSVQPWHDQPRRIGWITLAVLLLLTAGAYAYVRRLLRPLDDIRTGAQRFGRGDFAEAIPVRRNDELGDLAQDVNAMGRDIHQMLEAKRALLLAISHELRSPLTRARINTELLPETPELASMRDALLRDLAEMRDLVTDLLESERLGRGHAALQLEPTDLAALVREVAEGLAANGAQPVRLDLAPGLPLLPLDRSRMRLLVRNLLDNALRHSTEAAQPPVVRLARVSEGEAGGDAEGGGIVLTVRDHGPGVDEAILPHLAEPFYRPDASRERATGGVGLGLYLCRLVAQAHGASWAVRNARPGLEVRVVLPNASKRMG